MIEQQTYSSCPHGEGFEGIGGFQVRGRSEGLTDEMSRAILPYGNHYGVPGDLRREEYEYYREGRELDNRILERFPVTLTYHHVEGEYYGLTRVKYVGKDYTRRPGNFLAHTLVFPYAELQAFDYNPVFLYESGVFDNVDAEGIRLESLPDFTSCVPPVAENAREWISWVGDEHFREVFQGLLSAVVGGMHLERPVILRFSGDRDAFGFIGAFLMLLPPPMRCRMTFTTYEPNPYGVLRVGSGDVGTENLHIVTTIGQDRGGSFEFRPHEMNRFFIYDFVEKRFSQFPLAGNYCRTVMRVFTQPERLNRIHGGLERLGAGLLPGTWDVLADIEGIHGKLDIGESRERIPAVLDTLLETVRESRPMERALEVVWELLEKTAEEPGDDLFIAVFDRFKMLLERLPRENIVRKKITGDLRDLVCHAIISGNIDRASILASSEPDARARMLEGAMARLNKKGWPRIDDSIVNGEFTKRLDTLVRLADDPIMAEWAAGKLWGIVKFHMTRTVADDRYDRALHQLLPILERLDPRSGFIRALDREAVDFISFLLVNRLPVRALKMLKLFDEDETDVLEDIIRKLMAAQWPCELMNQARPRNGERKAWEKVTGVMIGGILERKPEKENLYVLLDTAFHFAQWCECAGSMWRTYRDELYGELFIHSVSPGAAGLIKTLKEVLSGFGYWEDLYKLVYKQTETRSPGSFGEWSERVCELTRLAVRCRDEGGKTADIVKLIRPPMEEEIRVLLLGLMYGAATTDLQVQAVIMEAYERAGKSADSIWMPRSWLAQGENGGYALLAKDFTGCMLSVEENADQVLDEWNTRLFSRYTVLVPFIARFISSMLREEQAAPGIFTLAVRYLEVFGKQCSGRCVPLTAAFISRAPMDTLAEHWNSWFQREGIKDPATPAAVERSRLMAWVKEIEEKKENGALDGSLAMKYLRQWHDRRLKLDRAAETWTGKKLLDVFSHIDFSSRREYRSVLDKCLQAYRDKNPEDALNVLLRGVNHEPVSGVFLLSAAVQTGILDTRSDEAAVLADLISRFSSNIQTGIMDRVWKSMEERVAQQGEEAIAKLKEFRRMTKPAGGLVRFGKKLLGRFRNRGPQRENEPAEKKNGMEMGET